MNKAKVKKFLKTECAGYTCIVFTRETLEKLASLLKDDDEIVIEPWASDGESRLTISGIGDNPLLEI